MTVDLADRGDVERIARGDIIDQALDDWSIIGKTPKIGNALEFVSDPFRSPMELSGLFSGRLDVITNRKDFDFSVTLFELTPAGDYVQLSYYWARASFVRDRSHRHLLTPGRRMHLAFTRSPHQPPPPAWQPSGGAPRRHQAAGRANQLRHRQRRE
jgi:hypothetical protein